MEDISNIQVIVALLISLATLGGIIIKVLNKMLDSKLKGLYDNDRIQYRLEICNFAGDLRNGIVKTRDEFQAIYDIYGRYEEIVDRFKLKNHYIEGEIAYIKERYKDLDRKEVKENG